MKLWCAVAFIVLCILALSWALVYYGDDEDNGDGYGP